LTTCDECETISREIKECAAEMKRNTDLTQPDRRLAVEALRGGTEEDAVRFKEVVSGPLFEESAALSSRIARAMNMKMLHEKRTGHRISL
jgi:hypothetical protein